MPVWLDKSCIGNENQAQLHFFKIGTAHDDTQEVSHFVTLGLAGVCVGNTGIELSDAQHRIEDVGDWLADCGLVDSVFLVDSRKQQALASQGVGLRSSQYHATFQIEVELALLIRYAVCLLRSHSKRNTVQFLPWLRLPA